VDTCLQPHVASVTSLARPRVLQLEYRTSTAVALAVASMLNTTYTPYGISSLRNASPKPPRPPGSTTCLKCHSTAPEEIMPCFPFRCSRTAFYHRILPCIPRPRACLDTRFRRETTHATWRLVLLHGHAKVLDRGSSAVLDPARTSISRFELLPHTVLRSEMGNSVFLW
jgi:hypothetical protein